MMHFSAAMSGRMGRLIDTMGTSAFAPAVFAFLDAMIPIDHCAVFVFPEGGPPHPLLAQGRTPQVQNTAQALARDYVGGAFEQDPVFGIVKNHTARGDGNAAVDRIQAAAISNPAYRRRFYEEPRIAEELNVIAEQDGLRYYACLFRTAAQPRFTPAEVETLRLYAPLMMKLLRRHVEISGCLHARAEPDVGAMRLGRREQLLQRVREVLRDGGLVSPREADICAHIALGYTIVSIGLNLGITINTVATHRKRAYAKLGISSQNELFAQYLGTANTLVC